MDAKQAREYANTRLKEVSGSNKIIFDNIINEIRKSIEQDPTKKYITVTVPPKQVIAWLENMQCPYNTAIRSSGRNETELLISWSEDGIKNYGNNDYSANR